MMLHQLSSSIQNSITNTKLIRALCQAKQVNTIDDILHYYNENNNNNLTTTGSNIEEQQNQLLLLQTKRKQLIAILSTYMKQRQVEIIQLPHVTAPRNNNTNEELIHDIIIPLPE